jgi:uncharacterized protein YgiM (DUF1202 family)
MKTNLFKYLFIFLLTINAVIVAADIKVKYDNTPVRDKPSIENSQITSYIKTKDNISIITNTGMLEEINGVKDNWYEIQFNGKTGWVFGDRLNILPDKESESTFKRLEGEWIDKLWYNTFRKTKSPNKAAKTKCSIPIGRTIRFLKEKDGFTMDISGFAEGRGKRYFGEILPTSIGGIYKLIKGYYWKRNAYEDTNILANIKFIDSSNILCSVYEETEDMKSEKYTGQYIKTKPNLSTLVNNSITGTYKDDSGNKYVFSSDGKVIWKGESMAFSILLNFSMPVPQDSDDMIRIGNKGYAYAIKNNDLMLYEKKNLEEISVNEHKSPTLILHKDK